MLTLSYDGIPYTVKAPDCIIILPASSLQEIGASPGASMTVVGFPWNAISHIRPVSRYVWDQFDLIRNNPRLHIDKEDSDILDSYVDLTLRRSVLEENIHVTEASFLIFQAFLFELFRIVDKNRDSQDSEGRKADKTYVRNRFSISSLSC